ncbi:hypothetical protein AB5L52_06740 [Streptomyces sp. CG4]|uniref:hypothetical protein n=1 Tax=Streptomyces sp. CG4 TaxID=408783 RepID=UPI0034E2CA20
MPEGGENQRPVEDQNGRVDEDSVLAGLRKDASRLSDEVIRQRLIDSGITAERASELLRQHGSSGEVTSSRTPQERQQDFDRAEKHFNAALSRTRIERPARTPSEGNASAVDQPVEDQSFSDEGDR